jgi:hypothetical protein
LCNLRRNGNFRPSFIIGKIPKILILLKYVNISILNFLKSITLTCVGSNLRFIRNLVKLYIGLLGVEMMRFPSDFSKLIIFSINGLGLYDIY